MSNAAEKQPKDRRRQEILDVAFREFSEKGYGGASMEAIARRAHASKETLYAWFADKQTLFSTLYAARLDTLASRVVPAFEQNPAPSNVLPIIAEDVIRFVLTITPLVNAVGSGGPRNAAARAIGRAIADERRNFVRYIAWCRDKGYIAFDDDPFEITSLFVAMAQGEWGMRLGTGMIDKISDKMIQDHAQMVTRIFLRGLAPKKRADQSSSGRVASR